MVDFIINISFIDWVCPFSCGQKLITPMDNAAWGPTKPSDIYSTCLRYRRQNLEIKEFSFISLHFGSPETINVDFINISLAAGKSNLPHGKINILHFWVIFDQRLKL